MSVIAVARKPRPKFGWSEEIAVDLKHRQQAMEIQAARDTKAERLKAILGWDDDNPALEIYGPPSEARQTDSRFPTPAEQWNDPMPKRVVLAAWETPRGSIAAPNPFKWIQRALEVLKETGCRRVISAQWCLGHDDSTVVVPYPAV